MTKFKGHELLVGDMVDIDGVVFIVKVPIHHTACGHMERLTGIEVLYKEWWKNLLADLGFIKPKMWYETITLYYNNTYRVLGNGREI